MKLWVDDERPAPDRTWRVARTSADAIDVLYHQGCEPPNLKSGESDDWIEEISLDHDLGGDDTGFKVIDWMVEWAEFPPVITVHTSNPPARKRMLAALNAEAPREVQIFVITDHLS